VKVENADTEIAPGGTPASGELSSQALQPGYPIPATASSSEINRPGALRAVLKASLLGIGILLIPILGIVLTGAVAVYFYHRENGFALPAGFGSRLGGAAGVAAFAMFMAVSTFVFHAHQPNADDFTKMAQSFGTDVTDAEFQASVRFLFTPAGRAAMFFLSFVIAWVLAAVGGALASAFLRRRNAR
jgi:hypothetical protein